MLQLNAWQSEFKVTAQCFQLYIINYNMSEIAFLYVKINTLCWMVWAYQQQNCVGVYWSIKISKHLIGQHSQWANATSWPKTYEEIASIYKMVCLIHKSEVGVLEVFLYSCMLWTQKKWTQAIKKVRFSLDSYFKINPKLKYPSLI